MARSTMEVAFLGTQKLAFSQNGTEVKIVKVFYGDEPDGQTENGLSIVSMDVPLEVADEVFASGANFDRWKPCAFISRSPELANRRATISACIWSRPRPTPPRPASPASNPPNNPASLRPAPSRNQPKPTKGRGGPC
jgi:hypothetical protein